MPVNVHKKTKSIMVETNEDGNYTFTEIPIHAFAFGRISFKYEDDRADRIENLCDLALLDTN